VCVFLWEDPGLRTSSGLRAVGSCTLLRVEEQKSRERKKRKSGKGKKIKKREEEEKESEKEEKEEEVDNTEKAVEKVEEEKEKKKRTSCEGPSRLGAGETGFGFCRGRLAFGMDTSLRICIGKTGFVLLAS